ncbi:MAG: Asp23/Gls24 family envelope stress response protein [Solobacterium sp.]|nr:Asp23/Gls24 family envelope stress response protein [Solobacterium sp.]
MAQDYVVVNEKSENGMIAVNKSVFQAIADISLSEIENISASENGRFAKPTQVKIENNKLIISADIKVKYGANVSAACELLQNKIYENILFMTGYKASDVRVNVVGFEI